MKERTSFNILIVDDEPIIVGMLEQSLKPDKYTLTTATSGEECLRMIRQEKPDILLLDVILQDMNGFDICHAIKKDPELSSIYIILLSGVKIDSDDRADGIETGADDYMLKPINPRELKAKVDAAFWSIEAEKKIRKNQEDLEITLNAIGDGVISTSSEGNITRINPAAQKLCGWTEAEAFGKPLTEIFRIINADTRLEVENPVSQVISKGEVVGLANHTLLIAKDGTERQIADSAAPIKNKQGQITGVVLVFSDVTEKHAAILALEKSEQAFRNLFNNISEGVAIHEMVYDTQGVAVDYRILNVNPAFEKQTGVNRDLVTGKLSREAYGVADPPYLKEYGHVAETCEPLVFETYFPPMDKYFLISVSAPQKGQFVTMFLDISVQKKAEVRVTENEKLLRESQEVARLGSYSWDLNTGLWSSSEILDKIFGINEQYHRTLEGWSNFQCLFYSTWKMTGDH